MECLSRQEHERAASFTSTALRRRYVAGRTILRSLLTRYTGIPARNIMFGYQMHGNRSSPLTIDRDFSSTSLIPAIWHWLHSVVPRQSELTWGIYVQSWRGVQHGTTSPKSPPAPAFAGRSRTRPSTSHDQRIQPRAQFRTRKARTLGNLLVVRTCSPSPSIRSVACANPHGALPSAPSARAATSSSSRPAPNSSHHRRPESTSAINRPKCESLLRDIDFCRWKAKS
jgi:hypothetical protein